MRAKKLSISIFLIIVILFGAISALVYNKADSVKVVCFEGSYAEEYAKENKLDYELISDSESYIGMVNLEKFGYNDDGSIVSYKGSSEKIAIPTEIYGKTVQRVGENTFDNAENVKVIYIPKSVTKFQPRNLSEDVTVYMYSDTELYKELIKDETVKFQIKKIPDSLVVDYFSGDIPFAYNNVSDKSVKITSYKGNSTKVTIPESINGKVVTAISFDALGQNIDTIIIPESVTSIEKDLYSKRYDLKFVIGLAMALVSALIASAVVLTLKADSKEQTFLRITQVKTAYTVVILSVILSAIYLLMNAYEWIVYVAFVVLYAIAAISVLKKKVAVEAIEAVDKKVKVQTAFIKTLTVDAECLMNATKSDELKALAKKVYEAVRYSDPMSNDALAGVEEKIQSGFYNFENAVKLENPELAASTADEIISLIDNRNKKCKLLK